MKFKIRIGFTIFLVIIFSYAIVNAWVSLPFGAAVTPLVVAISAFVLCLFQLSKEIYDHIKNNDASGSGDFVDIAQDTSITSLSNLKGAGEMMLWITGLYLGIWIAGFKIAVVSFFIIYLRKKAQISWRLTLALTAVSGYFIFIHFENLMSIHWPNCLLSNVFNIPWLLG